ncbi:MAG: hypothetical protein Q8930_12125 [Bacillota bacterium]|nr:hypothetical protein [Bacillota bacterium]
MKVIILNRKRIGVTIIIIGLMLVLAGAEIKLNQRLRMTVLMQNGLDSLKQYEIKNSTITYKLPDIWETTEKNFGGNEITYHNEFSSSDNTIYGYVEVWNLRQKDLQTFLENSKTSAFNPERVKNFKYVPVKLNSYPGYLATYTGSTASGKYFRAYEYFVENGSTFFRMAFYVPADKFKENMPAIFESIAGTYARK